MDSSVKAKISVSMNEMTETDIAK